MWKQYLVFLKNRNLSYKNKRSILSAILREGNKYLFQKLRIQSNLSSIPSTVRTPDCEDQAHLFDSVAGADTCNLQMQCLLSSQLIQSTQFSSVSLSVPSLVCVMEQQWHSRTRGSQSVSPETVARVINNLVIIQQVDLGLVSLVSSKKSTLQVRSREIGNEEHSEMQQLLQSIAAARQAPARRCSLLAATLWSKDKASTATVLSISYNLYILWHNLYPMISYCCCFSPPSINKSQVHLF